LAAPRRAELLDAVESVILEGGVESVTVARVAAVAGVRPGLVHHYLGARDAMLRAAVERLLDRIRTALAPALPDASDERGRLEAQVDAMFGGAFDDPRINQLIDHLVAASYVDEDIRASLTALYRQAARELRASLRRAAPTTSPEQLHVVASALLALAHAGPTLNWLAVTRRWRPELRAAAKLLLTTLR
jgi:TetR/AcrR family transcriptional repressor of bet genes